MKKYIDAEKLIAEIKGLQCEQGFETGEEERGYQFAIKDILNIISSLQQEQPKSTCKTCGFYENNCPFIRGKLVPYPNSVCKDYIYSAMKEQEQPDVDLKKEESVGVAESPLKTFQRVNDFESGGGYRH